jgi:hypothetical protein
MQTIIPDYICLNILRVIDSKDSNRLYDLVNQKQYTVFASVFVEYVVCLHFAQM